ncbi:MAG: serine/threonine-protein phosphatase [Bryobacterales bacterium]|nr:serine/threonine-protein phosphatase [Bryobacterales bacterium]
MTTSELTFDTAVVSSAGGREANQDEARFQLSSGGGCWVLCDGLGGHGGGETAARIAAATILQCHEQYAECSPPALRTYLESARRAVLAERVNNPYLAAMNSTAVLLVAAAGTALWAHVGDSRLYWFRNGRLQSQTLDHSVPQSLAAAGKINARDIRFHEDRNKLLRTLAGGETLEPGVAAEAVHLKPGDSFLLASDGLWELVRETEMEVELARSSTAQAWLCGIETRLRSRTFAGHDNYSAIALRVHDQPPGPPPAMAAAPKPAGVQTSSSIELPKTERPLPRLKPGGNQ